AHGKVLDRAPSLFPPTKRHFEGGCSVHKTGKGKLRAVRLSRAGKMTVEPISTADRPTSLPKLKFPKFRKGNIFKKNAQIKNNDIQCAETPLNFKQNLKHQHFTEAGRQLIHREERLFSVKQDGVGSSKSLVEEEVDYDESLKKNYEELYEAVWSTVENTFNVQTEEEKKALKQAVQLIQQEEEQDRRWEGVVEKERPPWRPQCCKRAHDSRLQNMVLRRMEEAKLDSNTGVQSSIQKEITGKGKRLKEDLLHITKHVRSCYPEENVCQLYAELYHQAFCAKLREITDYGLSDGDCSHVLQWVNKHYSSILNHEELTGVIKYEKLEALLPDNILQPLEEQFLAYKENELQTWCQNIIKEEKAEHELRDGYYFSHLAIDVIEVLLNEIHNRQTRISSLSTYLRTECMNLLTSIRELCHGYFTKPIQKDLKGKYSKLGTREWLKHSEDVCGELLDGVETHIKSFTNLEKSCLEELLSHLHKEVLTEYVRKMMKRKIKLGDEKKQQQAAKALHDNSQKIHTLFTEAGSNLDDLKTILPRLAELLTLKDPQFIELDLVGLSKSYPGFRAVGDRMAESQDTKCQESENGNLKNLFVSFIRRISKKGGDPKTEGSADTPKTFKQNLKEQHFTEAGRQLIHREERLFSVKQDAVGSSKSLVEEKEDDIESLSEDYEELYKAVWSAVENTFKVQKEKEKEALKQAVQLIQQEEEQDRRWEGVVEKERPPWRPQCCKRTHDSRLQKMVMRRMEEAKLDSNTGILSSIQKEITGKGKRLKEDLLHITKHVRSCYPEENVCQLYAELYHQAFCAKLREITDYGLSDGDCSHVLQWVNIHYSSILTHEELTGVIKYEKLEALLPDNILQPLEEQFLAYKENELQTWCQNIIKEEKAEPELRDGYYFTHLAIDVIECFHAAVTAAQTVLGSSSKSQRVTHQMKEFLQSYQDYLKNVTEDNQGNSEAVLKANLHCIRQFRKYITDKQDLFPAHIRTECMNLLTSIRELCHGYFTKPIQKDLKGKYSKLGTRKWLKHSEDVCGELLDGVKTHIQNFTNLEKSCLEELLSHLHKEVLTEYVRKMMKRNIKLGDEKKQQQAAKALHDNGQKIHTLFTEAGSNLDDLKTILPRLAELLILKDPQFIELELVGLSKSYPGFSAAHVCAWLYLKGNLSASELKAIKKTFSEFQLSNTPGEADDQEQDPLYSSSNFFSKVLVK
ncbi:hypothetical protein NFI96_025542, partial [Prochilodus magdalenae]